MLPTTPNSTFNPIGIPNFLSKCQSLDSQFRQLGVIHPLQTTLLHPGIVSTRVGFVLRSTEIQPALSDVQLLFNSDGVKGLGFRV